MKAILLSLLVITVCFSKMPDGRIQQISKKIQKDKIKACLNLVDGIVYFTIDLKDNKLTSQDCKDLIRLASAKCDCNYNIELLNSNECKIDK